jgi:hypothetical protein
MSGHNQFSNDKINYDNRFQNIYETPYQHTMHGGNSGFEQMQIQ